MQNENIIILCGKNKIDDLLLNTKLFLKHKILFVDVIFEYIKQ